MHVPRASGSSLHAWFRQSLGKGGVAQANAAAAVAQAVVGRHEPGMPGVVSGHFTYGVHELLEGRPYRYVVLLRDPVQRVLSLFRYIRSLPTHDLHAELIRPDMTIARFYADKVPGSGPRNAMVAQLAGVLGTRVTLGREHLEQATAHLFDDRTLFGLAEHPASLLQRLAEILGVQLAPELPQVNRLGTAQAWGGSPEDIAAISTNNQLDIELYRRATRSG